MNRKILKGRLAALWLPVVFLYIFTLPVPAEEQVISKGIFIQGVDCAGMNKDQAAAAIDQKIAELGTQQVTITVGDQSTTCTLAQLGLTWTNRDVLNDMLELGSSGNIVQRYKDRKDLEHTTRQFRLTFSAGDAHLASPSSIVGSSSLLAFTLEFSISNALVFSFKVDAISDNSLLDCSRLWVRLVMSAFAFISSSSFACS